jgi:hypothetical protein
MERVICEVGTPSNSLGNCCLYTTPHREVYAYQGVSWPYGSRWHLKGSGALRDRCNGQRAPGDAWERPSLLASLRAFRSALKGWGRGRSLSLVSVGDANSGAMGRESKRRLPSHEMKSGSRRLLCVPMLSRTTSKFIGGGISHVAQVFKIICSLNQDHIGRCPLRLIFLRTRGPPQESRELLV